jgi:hypothetical protein
VRGVISIATLAMVPRAVGSRGSIDASYERALFASAYGRAYYKGFVDSTGAIGVTFADEAPTQPGTPRGRGLAVGLAVVGGVSGLAAVTTGILAWRARSDFDSTMLQRPAEEARQRYARYLPISIATGGVAVAASVGAYLLWPRSRVHVVPSGEAGLGVEVAW